MARRRRRDELHANSTEDFLVTVRTILGGLSRMFETHVSQQQLEDATSQIREIRVNCQRMANALSDFPDVLQTVEAVEQHLATLGADPQDARPQAAANVAVRDGRVGRPMMDFDNDRLRHLLLTGFSISHIARDGLLGQTVHRRTIYNHMARHGLSHPRQEFRIAEDELREIICNYIHTHPNSGAEEIRAYLRGHDPPVVVTRSRIRAMVLEIDPEGVASRWSQVIRRRQYAVAGPNCLWHIDSHHSLVRYGIFVHAGVDGYSRLVTYLKAAPFNTAKVAYQCFLEGVERYGVPSRIRIDRGVENGVIKQFMVTANGANRGSYIEGRSVHNQRVERLWKDVFSKVLYRFYVTIHAMEDSRAVDVNNPLHIYCLQAVFIPRINKFLEEWRRTKNTQPLRTVQHRSPDQLWMTGFQQLPEHSTARRNILTHPGVEAITRQIFPETTLEPSVFFARVPASIDIPRHIQDGVRSIDVLKDVHDFGVELYGEVLEYVIGSM